MSKSLGQRIKEYRKAAGLTQRQLSDRCGWGKENQSRIGNYESDAREPSLADIDVIAKALRIDRSLLLLGTVLPPVDTPIDPAPVATSAAALSPDEALLLERFRGETDKRVRDFALTALINGYTSAPRHSVTSQSPTPLLEDIFAGLLDIDLDAYFAQPESKRRKEEIELGRKVIGILDRRKRTLDPREVGREYERDSDKGMMPGIAK